MTAPVRPVGPEVSHDELAARLRLAVARLARRLRGEVGGDVSPSQLSALASVARQGPLTLTELSAAEHVSPPTMTRVVARLEEQGLVTRTVDPADRRVARLATTPAGRRFLDDARHRKDTYLAARLLLLEPEDQAVLARATEVLERLLDNEGPSERAARGPSGPSERAARGPSGPSERAARGPSGPSERAAQ